jgi:ATP-dependent Lon protease
MPIGGLKEKLLAAHRNQIQTVLIPKENRKDLKEIPRRVLNALRVVLVDHMDDVLREALRFEDPEALFGPRKLVLEYRNGELVQDEDQGVPTRPSVPPSPEEQPGLS